ARDPLHSEGGTVGLRLTGEKHKARAGVREDVLHFRFTEARIYRHHQGAREKRTPECDAPIQTVAKANCDSVAALDSKIVQAAGYTGCALPQCGIVDSLTAEFDDGFVVGNTVNGCPQ